MLPQFHFLLYYNACCSSGKVSNLQSTVFSILHFKPFTKALSGLLYDNHEYTNAKILVWYRYINYIANKSFPPQF